ncbi:MAG: hypothetical protein WCV79_01090 [Candidatus Paceibacterota bacterium]
MATDGPDPKPCDPEIFKKGHGVCVVDGSSNAVERWVRSVAKKAKARVDWHYCGGRANVLHLGDSKSRERVLQAIEELKGSLKGRILSVDGPSLYRKGVKSEGVNVAQGAIVRKVNGKLVLDDPEALAVARAIAKSNCRITLEQNADRVQHFKNRIRERGLSAEQVLIVLLNVDDPHGGPIAELLMPGHNWQEYRDKGEVPFARGLAQRSGIEEIIGKFDTEAAKKLSETKDIAVAVVDHGVAEVFEA